MGAEQLQPIGEKKPFVVVESYKHLFAKNLLAKWFRDEEIREKDHCKVAQFPWRVNYGVFTELPFHKSSDPYYFELSKWVDIELSSQYPKEPLKWFTRRNTSRILFIPDMVVFHKGSPLYIFEIVHKNPLSPEKVKAIYDFFNGHPPELHMIEAEEILKQTHVPQFLHTTQIF